MKTILLLIGIIFLLFIILFIYSSLVVAATSDKEMSNYKSFKE